MVVPIVLVVQLFEELTVSVVAEVQLSLLRAGIVEAQIPNDPLLALLKLQNLTKIVCPGVNPVAVIDDIDPFELDSSSHAKSVKPAQVPV